MLNIFARFFLTFSAVSLFVVVYIVKSNCNLISFLPAWVSYLMYLVISIVLAPIALFICRGFSPFTITDIEQIEPANNKFLPNYLAFFFVALAIPESSDCNLFAAPAFWFVFGLITLLIFLSRVSYFNPLFFFFGYNFYYVTFQKVRVMLISKKELKMQSQFEPLNVKKINNYAFIEVESQ